MDPVHDDRYMVFVRTDRGHGRRHPARAEKLLASCATYEEARRIQRRLLAGARTCVIRYLGPAGGGD